MTLKEEIGGEPDQPNSSIFDYDSDEESTDSESCEDPCTTASAPGVAASALAGNVAADPCSDRMSSIGSLLGVGKFSLEDADRKQSWEYQLRGSSLAHTDLRDTLSDDVAQEQLGIAESSRKRKATSGKAAKRKKQAPVDRSLSAPSPVEDEEVETVDVPEKEIRPDDILGGRGGLSNHHVGNKRFRQIVADMKENYRQTGVKTDKTALSKGIVQYVHIKGGRFLIKKGEGQVGWTTMTTAEARKKTSQALRETKELKWVLSSTQDPDPTQEPTNEA